MKDETIVKIAEKTEKILLRMEFHEPCDQLLPSYNALLTAARENHPEDGFIQALQPISALPKGSTNQLHILFSQLRIALEALMEPE